MGIGNLFKKYFMLGFIILILVSSGVSTDINGFIAEASETKNDKDFYEINFNKFTECGKKKTILQMESKNQNISKSTATYGPANSPWPMKCHDTHHTSRSEYGTTNNSYYELWRYKFDDQVDNDPAIGEDGTVYVGGSYEKLQQYLYAFYPDGTMRWRYRADGLIWHMCPAVAEDGTIYFGSWDECLHAVNPDGSRKWKFDTNGNLVSDPVIGEDGTIYFGNFGSKIFALNPDGSEKWRYKTGGDITSDPAIGDDGTIYIGSRDNYLYAINPNGTLKWRFKTGYWIKAPPSVAEDGTVYISSYDDHLYALYPNGTLRWKTEKGYGSDTNPSIGSDGAIYVVSINQLRALNPYGSKKWDFHLGGSVKRSSPTICADGIIYVGIEIGDCKGGEMVAVNPDGTLRWRERLSNEWIDSSPCIGEDGIIYVVSSNGGSSNLHAFGSGGLVETDANGPYYGYINKPVNFSSYTLYGYPPYTWNWDFGDGNTSDEQNPLHIYDAPGRYIVTLTVTDTQGNYSEDVTWTTVQDTNNPPNNPVIKGPRFGKIDEDINFTFRSEDPEDNEIWYYIDWGDSHTKGWIGWHESGGEITLNLWWYQFGVHTIKAKARDGYGDESNWSYYKVIVPKNHNMWLIHWLNKFPICKKFLGVIMI
jgi:outer membrane protein assembly factor BamB